MFAGSERSVFVSFDDGDHWQTLRLNMPATSIRDLVIKDDDIVVGTHGRSFWILDDMTLLRQMTPQYLATDALFFKPQLATRVRWNMNPDTPLPQEEPAGQNPPDGAIFDYFLKENVKNTVLLEIFDKDKKCVRRFASDDKPYKIPDVNIPQYWIREQQILSAAKGAHRFVWDMHYAPLDVQPSYPIAATFHQTAPDPTAPWVMVGEYVAKLTVNGKATEHPLSIRLDPRVKTSEKDLKMQHDLSYSCYLMRQALMADLKEINALKTILKTITLPKNEATTAASIKALDTTIATLESVKPNANSLDAALNGIFNILHDTEMPPTTQTVIAVNETKKLVENWQKQWQTVKLKDIPPINIALKRLKMKEIGF